MNQEKKVALITGITGQDGSFLAEILLQKGYEVHGIIRRASTLNTGRIDHLYQDPHINGVKLFLHYGDLSDTGNIRKLIYKIQPDEVYHLAAQSHVRVSFDIPEFTAQITGLGTLRILEAIKDLEEQGGKKMKFYQASSSEMFGSSPPPQNEKTPFHPRSPYGSAKVFAYHTTVNYREAYGIFAVNGILFNHETIASFMPMFTKKTHETDFDIKPICEIVAFDEDRKAYQAKPISGIQVWGKSGWSDVTYASAYPHDKEHNNKHPRFINSRSGAFMATGSHIVFIADGIEKETAKIEVGDRLETVALPPFSDRTTISTSSEDEAELIGMMVGDGSITHARKGIGLNAKFTNCSPEIRERFSALWECVTGGRTVFWENYSGFNPERKVGQLRLVSGNDWLRSIDIYNKDGMKRVPKRILNSSKEVMYAFLKGYNATDGLKSNPCTYEFKNFKTNSPTLAMGIWYLIECVTEQEINLTVETKEDGRIFYSLNVLSTVDNAAKEETVRELVAADVSQRGIERMSGISRTFIRKIQFGGSHAAVHHLRKNPLEIKKIIELPNYDGWFYDLETTSGEFHCGVGKCHVHNSPRRGETFVTRKITRGIARILAGLDKKLYLGNLDARRDWGYAPEYMEMAWRMLQEDKPDDYVVGTGKSHSVREFLEAAFHYAGLEWRDYVEIDKRYFRPTEVENLIADARKAKEKLHWEPKTTFEELVKIMVDADKERYGPKK